jgi:ribosomal protein S12 methylthiotransferase
LNKVHFTSLGCARNLVDTEVMIGVLLRAGFSAVAEPQDADYLVVNTCGFLESAREEGFNTIETLFKEKKESAKIIVAGCMVRGSKNDLKERFPEIHAFLGSGDMEKILEAVLSEEKGEYLSDAKSYLQQGEVPRTLSTPKHYAYLKIAEGCKKRCAFCIIPLIKGKLISKSISQVMKEFLVLVNEGCKEIILIAQDLGDFGKDRGETDGLEELLTEMAKVRGDYWIRLLYLYPDEITAGVIDILKKNPQICPYLDMPLQHINDRILKRMHRKTDRNQIESIISMLRKEIPEIVIRTSLMVGFPGETEEEFLELLEFVKTAKLDNVGIFKYSREEESYSAKLDGHVSEEVKEDRFQRLAEAQAKTLNLKKYKGQRLKVLVDGYHPESKDLLVGRFYGQCPEIDGRIILNDWSKVTKLGDFYEVEITDVIGYDLVGRVLSTQKRKPKLCISPS